KDHPIFLNDNEDHSKESLENSFDDFATLNSNEEKEEPPQDSDIRNLIREECCVEASEEQKQSMKDTILELEVKNVVEQPAERGNHNIQSLQNFRVIHKSSISLNTSQISSIHAVVPILSTKEPEYSSSMGYENPNTTPEMESDEIIKSGVEELVPILSENEVTLEDKRECDLPVCENSPVCDNHSEIFSDSKIDDDILVYDDDFKDIEYVKASLSDPEIVSVEEENVVHQAGNDVNQEEEEVDLEDISQIQDVILQFDNSLSDNFSPEFETFCDHTEETKSGNTTHADNSLLKYDSFCFEIEPDQERLIYVVKNDISDDSSNDPLLEEANLFLAFDNSIPPGIENVADDSEGDIRFLEELLIDDSILSHESPNSNFEDNPSFPRPPPEPPDAETDEGEEIPIVMNDKDKFDEDYYFFIFDKVFSLLSVESEDTIFDLAKFVGDFKSFAKEADESLAKHKALELDIERLLRAVASQDIMSVVQNNSVDEASNLQTELERTKERFENCIIKKENEYAKLWNDWYKKCEECKFDKISYDKAYNNMQQKIERLQAQLGDLKGKSKDTSCVSDTLNPLSQKLENENVKLEFQVLNYANENAHLKTTYKNLFDSISVTRTQTRTIIDSLQIELQDTIYENSKLRAQLFDKVSEQKDTTRGKSANMI
nr:hypothetical protein [Tanacetum cinerariifolium]